MHEIKRATFFITLLFFLSIIFNISIQYLLYFLMNTTILMFFTATLLEFQF